MVNPCHPKACRHVKGAMSKAMHTCMTKFVVLGGVGIFFGGRAENCKSVKL